MGPKMKPKSKKQSDELTEVKRKLSPKETATRKVAEKAADKSRARAALAQGAEIRKAVGSTGRDKLLTSAIKKMR